jgi:GT2 family glycosyltransferase
MQAAPSPLRPQTWIMVLGYGNAKDTVDCLQHLRTHAGGLDRVAYLDNGSKPEEVQFVRESFPALVVLRLEKNAGIGRGFNAGWRWLLGQGAEWILTVCNDIQVQAGTMDALLNEAQAHPEVGMVVPKVYYHHDPSRIWSAGSRVRRFPPAIVHRKTRGPDAGQFNRAVPLPYAAMAISLVRAEALRTAGLLNPQYAYTYEDLDFCLRLRRRGYAIRYTPQATALHKSPVIGEDPRSPEFYRLYGRGTALFQRHLGGDEPALRRPLARWYLAARAAVESGWAGFQAFRAGWRQGQLEALASAPAWDHPSVEAPLHVSATNLHALSPH